MAKSTQVRGVRTYEHQRANERNCNWELKLGGTYEG